MKYYIVAEEWNYPSSSGRETSDVSYDSRDDAIAQCMSLAEGELRNFEESVGDALNPTRCVTDGEYDGVIITTKMGLDPFYYYARVIEVTPILDDDWSKVCKVRTIVMDDPSAM